MTPKELKNSILQLAIEGKLVEQRKEEGSAEVLYAEIQKEKQKLIKRGKIKKEKELPEITEDEIPFEIPKSWKWVRLGKILNVLVDGTHRTPKYKTRGIPFISVKNMSDGILRFDNTKFISKEEHKELIKRCFPEKGDILLSKVGTTGVPAKVETNIEFSLFVSVALLKFSNRLLNTNFLINLLLTPNVQKQCKEHTRGVGNKNWVIEDIANTIVPLPPLAEQKRIVEKIEELMPFVDRYEVLYNRLNELNKEFPKKLKNAVLQKAIEGKLVPQIKSEGSVDDLYKEIQKEKQKLIKQGKIKTEKELPEIIEDEVPFEIPKSWKLIKLSELCNIINGFTPLRTNEKFWKNGDIPWFTVDDIRSQGRIINYTNQKITKVALSKDSNRLLPKDTVLLCCTASVGEYAITKIPLTTNQQFNGLVIKEFWEKYYSPEFLLLLVQTFKDKLINVAGKTTFNFISVKKLGEFVIPFLPISEQRRIVEKIEEILPNIEKLVKHD